ncbi:MAG: hypothetical protein WD334_06870, partial [Chitinophagales bacterium]
MRFIEILFRKEFQPKNIFLKKSESVRKDQTNRQIRHERLHPSFSKCHPFGAQEIVKNKGCCLC